MLERFIDLAVAMAPAGEQRAFRKNLISWRDSLGQKQQEELETAIMKADPSDLDASLARKQLAPVAPYLRKYRPNKISYELAKSLYAAFKQFQTEPVDKPGEPVKCEPELPYIEPLSEPCEPVAEACEPLPEPREPLSEVYEPLPDSERQDIDKTSTKRKGRKKWK